jgi:hypothetical protein
MTQLQDKIQYVLDESRILILGAQVLVGFHYRAAFERGFQHLPETSAPDRDVVAPGADIQTRDCGAKGSLAPRLSSEALSSHEEGKPDCLPISYD